LIKIQGGSKKDLYIGIPNVTVSVQGVERLIVSTLSNVNVFVTLAIQ
jgi:hypothetical protein